MSVNETVGDAAAMREALTKVSEWMAHRIATGGLWAQMPYEAKENEAK